MEEYCSLSKKMRVREGQPIDSAASNGFPGSRTMLNFGAFNGPNRSSDPFARSFNLEEAAIDYFDEYFNQPEKKHRLSFDQVKFLERKFVEDSRLEPERKMQLAKELNLQPRQITIWFQNRRARSRTKQLETDYETLHESYTKLKNEYDDVLKENDRLKSQILCLKSDGPVGDIKKASNLQSEESFLPLDVPIEDINGMISPEDEESPQIQYFHLESGESSQVFELDQSDVSQNEKDEFLEPFSSFLASGDGSCDASDGSFYYGLSLEDQQQALNFWSY